MSSIGGATFSAEKVQNAPVIVKFETRPTDEIRVSLKALGLKWNTLRQEWEGDAKMEELTMVFEPHKVSSVKLDIPIA